MATLRELKGRIGSVASTEKITGAMKMISSAKMHKAEQALRRLLPFRNQVETIISNLLSADAEFSSPLTQEREVKHIGIVVLGSDDGLCGAYNVNLFKQLVARLNEYGEKYGRQVAITIYPVGKKLTKATAKLASKDIDVVKLDNVDSKTTGLGVNEFVDSLRDKFVKGEVDLIDVLYMNFKSISRQQPCFSQLMPVAPSVFTNTGQKSSCRPYIFEPCPATIFNSVLPMYLMSVMQEIFTENRASEQAARVMAMQSANDNAKKLLEQLQLEYNKLRQQSITTELLDILGGQVR